MKKSVRCFACLAVLAAAATAMAVAPLRVTAFLPEGKGNAENPIGDGMAKLKFILDPVNGNSIEAHLHLHQFLPNTAYSVNIDTDAGGGDFVGIATTNVDGDANVKFNFTIPVAFPPTAALITVYRNEIDDGCYTPDDPWTAVNEDECRAIGTEGF